MKKIGIICEDSSDFDAITELVRRISGIGNLSFERFFGKGTGKLFNKLDSYAKTLEIKKCTVLIVLHDKDRNDPDNLRGSLRSKLRDCKIANQLICIPIEELEAWFLSDMRAVRIVFTLKSEPKAIASPELVVSPKEELKRIVKRVSDKRKISIATLMNKRLAEEVNIDLVNRKCPSFRDFNNFVIGLR